MKGGQMVRIHPTVLLCFAVLTATLILTGCGVQQDMLGEMTGTWKSKVESARVNINLKGDQKTIAIGDRVVPVTVKEIKKDSYSVLVETKDGDGPSAEWSLREVWDDTGSDFKIEFIRGDVIDVLSRMDS
jgi:hypothetical protein